MRQLPIRWRIFLIAALNTVVAIILAALIWDGAQEPDRGAQRAAADARFRPPAGARWRARPSACRASSTAISRSPTPDAPEITQLRETLLTTLSNRASADPILAGSASGLVQATERFVAGFSDLRNVQRAIARTYESQVLKPAHEMAGLYAIMEGATRIARRADLAVAVASRASRFRPRWC